MCIRWEIEIPGTFSATDTKGMRRGYIDGKADIIGQYLVEVWNELMAEILGITKSEGGEMGKKLFVVLVRVVVVIDELGKEGLAVNM